MLSASRLHDGALGLAQWQDAGPTTERIPDLLDELQALADGQPLDVDGWVYHGLNLRRVTVRNNRPDLAIRVTYNASSAARRAT